MHFVLILWLALAGFVAPAAALPDGLLMRTLAGEEFPVTRAQFQAGGQVEMQTPAGVRRLEIRELLALEVAAAEDGAAAPHAEGDPALAVHLRLIGGTELSGRLLEGQEDRVRLEHADLGELRIAIDRIELLSFGQAGARVAPAGAADSGADLLYRRGALEGDVVRGTLMAVGPAGVRIDTDLGELGVPIEQALAVRVAPVEGVDAPAANAEVDLRRGGVLRGMIREIHGAQVILDAPFATGLALATSGVSRVRFLSDRFHYLSDLEPALVEQAPYFGTADDFLFPWRRDRTTTGRALEVGGRRFGKGLGLHSWTRLTYRLDGGYARFEGYAGISDEVRELKAGGSVVVRVQVDGRTVYESPVLRGGEPARAIPAVDLAGARELVLEVDFADDADVADRAVLGDALLIRAR